MKYGSMHVGLKMFLEQANDSPIAAYHAALLLEREFRGRAAQYFYLRAARGGYVPAMLKIASLLLTGQYICPEDERPLSRGKRDAVQGAAWIRSAAKTGDDTANYLMARCHWDGIGVGRNPSAARCCLRQVAFPQYASNPYEPAEAFVFGGISREFGAQVSRMQRAGSLPPAG